MNAGLPPDMIAVAVQFLAFLTVVIGVCLHHPPMSAVGVLIFLGCDLIMPRRPGP